jgi:hypothetical protein
MISSTWWLSRHLARLTAMVLFIAALAEAKPPINSGQGVTLHGTGPFEHVNIPLASAVLPDTVAAPNLAESYLPAPSPSTASGGCIWRMTMDRGELKAVCTGEGNQKTIAEGDGLVDAEFHAPFNGQTVTFEIKNVEARLSDIHGKTPPIVGSHFQYDVWWKLHDKAGLKPLCPWIVKGEKGAPDTTIFRKALAVPYAWSPSGEVLKNPDYFTFVCLPATQDMAMGPAYPAHTFFLGGGVIAKCIDMGFPPWDIGAPPAGAGSALQRHQACVRMATADYCNEGKANTIEGTPISFYAPQETKRPWDNTDLPIDATTQELRDQLDDYKLEAIWGLKKSGEPYLVCLGDKTRWKAVSLSGTCINRSLREYLQELATWTAVNPDDEIAHCKDLSLDQLQNKKNAILFTYSLLLDTPLAVFSVKLPAPVASADYVTTTSEASSGGSSVFHLAYELASGLPGANITSYLEGPILSADLLKSGSARNLDLLGLTELYRCQLDRGQDVLTSEHVLYSDQWSWLFPLARQCVFQGYIFSRAILLDERPLNLWWTTKDSPRRYLTSTLEPWLIDGSSKDAWAAPIELGFLPTVSAAKAWVEKHRPPNELLAPTPSEQEKPPETSTD